MPAPTPACSHPSWIQKSSDGMLQVITKGYKDVELRQFDTVFDEFPNATPVAIEVRENSENLINFEHPENPLYVFGPEDGGLGRVPLMHCHRFVMIPTMHCTNLAAAIYIILYDRMMKRIRDGLEDIKPMAEYLNEGRGFEECDVERELVHRAA